MPALFIGLAPLPPIAAAPREAEPTIRGERCECRHCAAHTFRVPTDRSATCHVCGSHKLDPIAR